MHNTSIKGRMTILFFISLISKVSWFETQKEQCDQKKRQSEREIFTYIQTHKGERAR